MISDEIMKEFYRKLIDRLTDISDALTANNEVIDGLNSNLQAINKTLKAFDSYKPELNMDHIIGKYTQIEPDGLRRREDPQ